MEETLTKSHPEVGPVRGRCKEDVCIVEFNRTNENIQNRVVDTLEGAGYEVVSGAVDQNGDTKYATEIRLRRLKGPHK